MSTRDACVVARRAVTNVIAVALVAPAVLATLRRTSRRAAFEAPVAFGGAGADEERAIPSSAGRDV